MRQNKSIKIFINYFLGPLLFVWLTYTIYRQLAAEPHLLQSWQHIRQSLFSPKIALLAFVVALMGVNWGIEAYKWQRSVLAVHPVSFWQSFKAVLSGVSLSVTLPNRIGEYAGRLFFLPEGARLKAVANTVGGSISQLLITLLSGLAALFFLQKEIQTFLHGRWFWVLFCFVAFTTVLLTFLYFSMPRLGGWAAQKKAGSRYRTFLQSLHHFDGQLLGQLLLLSTVRYAVFVAQYFLLFQLFEVHASITATWSVISVVFLTLAVVPNIALVEVGLRGTVSLQLMALFTPNSLGVLLATVSIWLINLVVPALIGSVLILRIKVFKRKHEAIEC